MFRAQRLRIIRRTLLVVVWLQDRVASIRNYLEDAHYRLGRGGPAMQRLWLADMESAEELRAICDLLAERGFGDYIPIPR